VRPAVVAETTFVCPACGPDAAAAPGRARILPIGFRLVACPGCGIQWQWPRPADAQLSALYTQEYYDAWGLRDAAEAVRVAKLATFDRLLARVERYVRPGALLDVGCATGFLLEAADRRGWEPHGVELSPYASRVAQRRFGASQVACGRLEDATFPDGFFAAVTMTDLIEHVPDPVGTARGAHRLLRPGGVLCLSTPKVGCLSYHLMGSHWTQYKSEHLQYFSPAAATRLLTRVGFGVVECGAWTKTVTLDYVRAQFVRYRHWLVSPLVEGLSRVLPSVLRTRQLSLPLGDMLVVAVRHG